MSDGFQGMDVPQARAAAHQMDGGAAQVKNLVNQVTALLGSVTWTGEDARRFQQDWHGAFQPQLRGAMTVLEEKARELRERAEAQENKSAGR